MISANSASAAVLGMSVSWLEYIIFSCFRHVMKCESTIKDAVYSSSLFCKTCGMDIGLNPVQKRKGARMELYCCEDCAENGGN